ncbi:tetratricopeptide repeat protein [Agrobacterium rosae]|uniref:tetratricopeptide repeat protein n=1 Tax=Agrobacterium rosae TaxID=1972867 RepID=UPI002A0B02C8|nr:tetratricopeptide repeat protein [Agrobacterium rosae]MDX8315973.1 tetratricopeptide repeat protein [Agrobacterium rosae]
MKLLSSKIFSNTRRKVNTLIIDADNHRDARRWAMARDTYAQALKIEGSLAHIWVQYGHALKESGDANGALASYHRALEMQPGNADTTLQIAHCLKVLGSIDEAKGWYLKALALDPLDDNAERELNFFDVPVSLYIPDLEKRRLTSHACSLEDRPLFFCYAGHSFFAHEDTLARLDLGSKLFKESDAQKAFGICTMDAEGRLVVVRPDTHEAGRAAQLVGGSLPRGTAVFFSLDTLMGIEGFAANVLQSSALGEIIPILIVDKVMKKQAAERFLNGREGAYLTARTLSVLTVALDARCVKLLDDIGSANNYPTSEVLEIVKGAQPLRAMQPGRGPLVIVAPDWKSRKLATVLSVLEHEVSSFVVLTESSDNNEPSLAGCSQSVYSQNGLDHLSNALVVVVLDDCVDLYNWVTIARSYYRPVVTGLIEAALRLWDKEICEFIDFSCVESINRISQLVLSPPSQDEYYSSHCEIVPNLFKIKEHSWRSNGGLPVFRFGELYAFKSHQVLALNKKLPSADRFRFGRHWADDPPKNGLNPKEWVIAGRLPKTVSRSPTMHILVENYGVSIETILWTSDGCEEMHDLLAGHKMWLHIKGEPIDGAIETFFGFKWRGSGLTCRPLAFVVASPEHSESWSGFLDQLEHNRDKYLV